MSRSKLKAPGSTGPQEPWKSFLKVLDSLLTEGVNLHCIGGFVITMRYGISRTTSDIDVLATLSGHRLAELQHLAGEGSSLHKKHKVYIQPVTVVTYPDEYESRLSRLWPSLRLERIRLFALEAHDLALTKLERNQDVDRDDVRALAAAGHLDPETLLERYRTELRPNLYTPPEKHDLTLELWIRMCWPSKAG